MTVLAIVTWLTSAAKFLKDAGADGMVKEGAKSVFAWLKEKFKRESEQDKIATIEQTPDNKQIMKDIEQIIIDSRREDPEIFAALQEQINNFSILVKNKMPEAASIIKNRIKDSDNIIINGTIKRIKTEGGDFHIGHNK